MRRLGWLLAVAVVLPWGMVRAADPLADAAVTAVAGLTDPRRLDLLPDDGTFRAQLGPALGWLHVARRRGVAPEATIVRAFGRNGINGERARLTREALLRNLARADAWELFGHEASARAMADGRPAPIPVGLHQGRLALAVMTSVPNSLLPDGGPREFACLVLRADDEPPLQRPAARVGRPVKRTRRSPSVRPAAVVPPLGPIIYDEPLPER